VILFWGSKVKGQGHRVNKCIFHTNVQSITEKRPNCSNFIQGMTLGYPASGMFWVERSKVKVRVRVTVNINAYSITQKRMIPKYSNLV